MIVRRRKVQATDKTVGICNIRKKDQHESPTPPRLAEGLRLSSLNAEREKRRNKYIPLRDADYQDDVTMSRGGRGRSLGREVCEGACGFIKAASKPLNRSLPRPDDSFFGEAFFL